LILIKIIPILIKRIGTDILHFHILTDYSYLFPQHQQYNKYNINSYSLRSCLRVFLR